MKKAAKTYMSQEKLEITKKKSVIDRFPTDQLRSGQLWQKQPTWFLHFYIYSFNN